MKKLITATLIAILPLLSIQVAPVAAHDHCVVVNGSFSNGLTGWSQNHVDSESVIPGYPTLSRHMPSYDDYDSIYQTVYLEDGDSLSVSTFLKVEDPDEIWNSIISVRILIGPILIESWGWATNPISWTEYVNDGWEVPDTGHYTLELYVKSRASKLWYDTLSISCE